MPAATKTKRRPVDNGSGTIQHPDQDLIPVENKLVIAPGKPYERVTIVRELQGRAGRRKAGPILAFMSDAMDADQDFKVLLSLTQRDEWEEVIVPTCLGLDDDEGRAWLDKYGSIMEIINAAMEGAQIVLGMMVDREDVQEALKKSGADRAKAEVAKAS